MNGPPPARKEIGATPAATATKGAIRQTIRHLLATAAPADLARRSAVIRQRLVAHPWWGEARTIALFAPLPTEPDLAPLWREAPAKRLCLPRVAGDRLVFYHVADPTGPAALAALAALAAGPLGIRQPPASAATQIEPAAIDLVIVPGLAFTAAGDRLGRGGGHYDRFLAQPALRARRLAVCFACQILPALPREPHDQPVGAPLSDGPAP